MTIHHLIYTLLFPLANALASPMKSYLITGANKGQGLALCERILKEHDDTHVFLCSRDIGRGLEAKSSLMGIVGEERVNVVPLDVTSDVSVDDALTIVKSTIANRSSGENPIKLCGVVSNAGILWGYPLKDLMEVCATGVKRVLDAFAPLVSEQSPLDGRLVVVTSGLGPLMHQYSGKERQQAMMSQDCTWDSISSMIDECLAAYVTTKDSSLDDRIEAFNKINFPGGPFADSAPDFHMYGLAKMFGDAYMKVTARKYPNLRVTSVDPGLVYTDLILRMPKYEGKEKEETTAQSPHEVSATYILFIVVSNVILIALHNRGLRQQ
jgi:NAD(P)-dependent dehydrogenase (short-subunit alcohol dehydrogenase family)